MNTRNTGQSRQNFLMNNFIGSRILRLDPQNIVRVTGHQIALLYFRVPAHSFLKAVEIFFRLSVQRDANDRNQPFIPAG
ncbi:hypothetical protein D3C81_1852430 [compost metagenome]